MSKQKKILVIRYRFLGDTILTVPFLDNLRELNPNAEIVVLTGPQSGQLIKNCPYIDRIIDFNSGTFHTYDRNIKKQNSFWHHLKIIKEENFDEVYILKRSLSSALLAFLAGIPKRIGFNTEFRGLLLTQKVKFDENRHEVINFLDHLPQPYNQATPSTQKYYWSTDEEKTKAKQLFNQLQSPTKRIIFHAPAAHAGKLWNIDKWAELFTLFKENQYTVIFSGAPSDNHFYEYIEANSNHKADLNLCTTDNNLRENVACYELADLVISVDSGPMHLAAAVQTPVLGIFGPTNTNRWHPWTQNHKIITSQRTLDCRPCNLKMTCNNRRECIEELSAKEVYDHAIEMISK